MSRSSQSCLPCSWPFDKCACSDVHAKEIAKKDGIITMLTEDLDYKITLCDKMAQKIMELEDLIHLHHQKLEIAEGELNKLLKKERNQA